MGTTEQIIAPLPTTNVPQLNRAAMTGEQGAGQHRNFNARFKTYLTRNLAYVYRLVTTAEGALSEELRHQVTHTLAYGLDLETNWPMARDLLLATAPDMELAGYREDWLPFLKQGVTQGILFGDPAAVAECQLQIGIIYRMLSDFEPAREVLLESIAGFAELHAARDQARSLNEVAWLEQLQHQFVEATAHVKHAATLLDADDPEQAVCLRVQGMIAIGYQRWEEAEALHRDALRRFAAVGDERRKAWSIQNVGYAIHGQKRYDEAIELYQQAVSLLEKLGDVHHLSFVRNNLGLAYQSIDNSELAVQCFESAIQIAENTNDKLHLARLYTNTGLSYLAIQDYPKAKRYFQMSAILYKALGTISFALNAQDGLAMAHIALQEYADAIEVIEEALAILPHLRSTPLYDYLHDSLNQHLEQARNHHTSHSGTSSALF